MIITYQSMNIIIHTPRKRNVKKRSHLKTTTEPIIVEALSMILKGRDKHINKIPDRYLNEIHKTALCRTPHFVRRVLSMKTNIQEKQQKT